MHFECTSSPTCLHFECPQSLRRTPKEGLVCSSPWSASPPCVRAPLALPHCASPHALPRTLLKHMPPLPLHFRSHVCGSLPDRADDVQAVPLHMMVVGLFLFGTRAAATRSHTPGELLACTRVPSHSAWSLLRPHTALHARLSPSAICCLSCACPSRAQVAHRDQDLCAVDSKQMLCAASGACWPYARVWEAGAKPTVPSACPARLRLRKPC
jgi:hypothetical protein